MEIKQTIIHITNEKNSVVSGGVESASGSFSDTGLWKLGVYFSLGIVRDIFPLVTMSSQQACKCFTYIS